MASVKKRFSLVTAYIRKRSEASSEDIMEDGEEVAANYIIRPVLSRCDGEPSDLSTKKDLRVSHEAWGNGREEEVRCSCVHETKTLQNANAPSAPALTSVTMTPVSDDASGGGKESTDQISDGNLNVDQKDGPPKKNEADEGKEESKSGELSKIQKLENVPEKKPCREDRLKTLKFSIDQILQQYAFSANKNDDGEEPSISETPRISYHALRDRRRRNMRNVIERHLSMLALCRATRKLTFKMTDLEETRFP